VSAREADKGLSLKALTAVFAGGNLLGLVFSLAGGFFTARFSSPSVLGLFNGMGLVLGYASFLQLGVLNGLNRELPYYIGRDDHEKARELSAAAQAWAIIIGGMTSSCLVIVAVWQTFLGRWDLAAGWLTYAVSAFFLFYSDNYLHTTYRTRGDFARLAIVEVIQKGMAMFMVILVWLFSFYGLCLRALFMVLINFSLLWIWRPLKIRPRWNKQQILHLLKIGAPIFGVGQLYSWWIVLDSTLVLKFAGTQGLGFYQVAILSSTALGLLPSALGQISYPRMAKEYGRTHSLEPLLQIVKKPTFLLVIGMIPIVTACWFILPPVIRLALPRYTEGIPAAQWALIAAAMLSFAPVNNVFNVIKRQDIYAFAIVTGMATYGASLLWLTRDNTYLAAFPQSMIIGRGLFLVVCYFYILRLKASERRGGR
jgi:O-antigen/teichoic acid export membrane protein